MLSNYRTKTKQLLGIFITALSISAPTFANESINASASFTADTAFTGANVLNPNVDIPISNATILVSNGNIVKIQPSNAPVPANYSTIDISNKWVIPGLVDGHVHLAQSGSAFTRPDQINATQITSYQQDQQWLSSNLQQLLKNYTRLGITSVFDMGGPTEYLQQYQQLPKENTFPDIYAAGTLLAPMEMPTLNHNGKTFTKVTTADDAKTLVKQLSNFGNSIVKVVWTQETGLTHQQLIELYQPAIELAKSQGKVVAAHVDSLTDAKMAIKAGATILLHGVMKEPVDEQLIEQMIEHNVTYMPTLTAYSHYFELFKDKLEFTQFEHQHGNGFVIDSFKKLAENKSKTDQMFQLISKYTPMVDASSKEISKLSSREQSIVKQLQTAFSDTYVSVQRSNLKQVLEAGVNVALGTDAGNPGTLHAASLYGEINAWQDTGISNKQILKAITFGNATALKLQDKIGSLFTGKHANFVVLDDNPYQTIATLQRPVMTVKRGTVIKTTSSMNKG